MSSRALPPSDDSGFPPPASVPQPRVYGRSARPDDEPAPDGPALDYRSGAAAGRATPPNGSPYPNFGPEARGSAAPPSAPVNGSAHGSASVGFNGGPGQRPPAQPPTQPPTRPQQGFAGTAQMRPVSPQERDFPGTGGWGAPPPPDREQDRFAAFRPEGPAPAPAAEPQAEPPAPKERNGRVLAMVLIAAVLLVAVPLGVVYLVTRPDSQAFSPSVGDCLKRDGDSAVAASCTEPGAFTVVSETNDGAKCEYKNDFVVLPADGTTRVLCLRPPGAAATPSAPAPSAS